MSNFPDEEEQNLSEEVQVSEESQEDSSTLASDPKDSPLRPDR